MLPEGTVPGHVIQDGVEGHQAQQVLRGEVGQDLQEDLRGECEEGGGPGCERERGEEVNE